ncbi:hypothetical protein [Rodentibacter trehalosifermentans]|uniref:hypothetical protein n=1 Tax=Rodentibacter trehalosifermentans TaxID=1908263 RepID=UPI001179CDD0|nr:hypothetical protein [Rodentibacter trehalosifermentans]
MLAGIGLILEDIYVWQAGGISVMGALVGRYGKWAVKIDQIKVLALRLWVYIREILHELTRWMKIDIDFDSWQGFATTTLQYILDGVHSLVSLLFHLAAAVSKVMRGDFAGAFDIAKESIGETGLAFMPFYLIAAKVLGGIASFIFAIFSPLRLLRVGLFGLGFGIGKAFKTAKFILGPIIGIGKVFVGLFRVGKSTVGVVGGLFKKLKSTYYILRAVGSHLGIFRAIGWGIGKGILAFDKFISLLKWGGRWIGKLGKASLMMSKAMISGIWAISKAMWAAMVANPILLAIGLIIAAVALIIYYWDDIKTVALEAWDFISKKAQEIIDDIGKWFTDMADQFGKKWDSIVESFKNIWNDAIQTVKNWFLGMIPDSVLNWFSDGDKQISASLNAASVNPVTPVFGNVGWGGLGVRPNNNVSNSQNIQQTNHITVNGTGNPTAVANKIGAAVGSFNGKFSIGQMEYQG